MAIPAFQAAGTFALGTAGISVAWPAHQAGDIGLLFTESQVGTVTLGVPAGFVETVNSPQADGVAASADSTQLGCYWCRATSGAMGAVSVNDAGDHVMGVILTFRGCVPTGNPWDILHGNTSGNTTSISVPGGTTGVPDALIVMAVSNSVSSITDQASSLTNAGLTGITQRFNENRVTGTGSGLMVSTGFKAAAGTFGASTGTMLTTTRQGRLMIALKGSPGFSTEAGHFTHTGKAVNLLRSRLVAGAKGSFALSGKAINFGLTHGYLMVAEKGNFIVTAYDSRLRKRFGAWEKQGELADVIWTKEPPLT